MKKKKIDISKIKTEEKGIKIGSSVRLYVSDKELLIEQFGSVQKALDALIDLVKRG